MKKKRVGMAWPILVVCALAITSCGPAATPQAPPPSEPTTPPTEEMQAPEPTQIEQEQPMGISEDVGVYAIAGDIPSLDPPYMLSEDTILGFNVYETLTRWDPNEGVIPILATSWESNTDATEWTFHLREGVTFHDGSAFTAEDVKASLDRNIEIGMVAYDFIGVDSIEVVDDFTVRFVSSEPRDLPLILSAQYGMFIYSAEAVGLGEEWFAEGNDAGTGPYLLDTWEPGTRAVLSMYQNYWGGWEEGQFTTVILEIVEDPTVRDQMIRSGEADITMELPIDSIESLRGVDGLTVEVWQPLAHLVAAFALHNSPLDNLQVREALAYSFPYEAVKDGVFGGYGTIPKGFGPTSLWNPPADFPQYTLDLERAAALLDEAGYGEGFELNVGLSAGSKETLDTLNLWQGELSKLNIQLNIQQLSGGAFWDYAYTPDQEEFQILMVPASGDVPSPYAWLIVFTSSPYGWFPAIGYSNPEFDQLVFDAWALEATDPTAADGLWVDAQRKLYEDAASVFVIDYPFVTAYRDNLGGYVPNPPYVYIVFWYDLSRQ